MRVQYGRAIAGILVVLILGACGRQGKVEAVVKESLKDPDSAKFGELYEKDGYGCILVNAKNSMGGYGGRQPVLLRIKGDSIRVIDFIEMKDKGCATLVDELIESEIKAAKRPEEEKKRLEEEKKRLEELEKWKARPRDPNMGTRSGESLYKSICGACHETGVAGAPAVGDVAAWKPRIKKGLDALMQTAITGKNAMPPRGGSDANDEELRLAIIYITNRSGGKFK